MKPNEEHFLKLIKAELIIVNFDTGKIVSWISGSAREIGRSHPQGYITCTAGGHTILAHRLIWLAHKQFLTEGFEINHKNGIKNDNRLENIEEITRSENTIHAYKVLGKVFGLFERDNRGEKNGRSLVTQEQVDEIRRLFDAGNCTQISLANKFGLKKSQIHNIVSRKQWID